MFPTKRFICSTKPQINTQNVQTHSKNALTTSTTCKQNQKRFYNFSRMNPHKTQRVMKTHHKKTLSKMFIKHS